MDTSFELAPRVLETKQFVNVEYQKTKQRKGRRHREQFEETHLPLIQHRVVQRLRLKLLVLAEKNFPNVDRY